MEINVKVISEEVCRFCPNLDIDKIDMIANGGDIYFRSWECRHIGMCSKIQKSLQKKENTDANILLDDSKERE